MPAELKDTLERLLSKTAILFEKYNLLLSQNSQMTEQLEDQSRELARLKEQVRVLKAENEYLQVARSVTPDGEKIAQYRQMVSKMVRDIDRCINQLNA